MSKTFCAASIPLFTLVGTLAGCGGGGDAPQPNDPSKVAAEQPVDDPTTAVDESAPPKKKSKYPEPFLEPDCSSVATDGYLPGGEAVLEAVRKKNWDRLKACVNDVSDVHGEVRTSFRLDPDGVPRCVEAPGSSIANEDVINCVVGVYRTFRYPSPQNGSVRITDGIAFDVSEGDDE